MSSHTYTRRSQNVPKAYVPAERVRWGICGTGEIASRFVAALGHVPDAEVVAVASHDPGRAAAFAGRYGVATTHLGYDSLADDDDVDVVYVASTQQRHVDDVVLFAEAGRNVLCEKPFALSVSQAETMIGAAAASSVFLMEAMWTRFLPSYLKLRELLDDGAIGTPQLVEANFSLRIPDGEVGGHRLFDPQRGGGALFDLGIYLVHLAHFVLGPPTHVHAAGHLTADGIDAQTSLLLEHEGGASSLLSTGLRINGSCGARITGTEGSIEIDPFMHATNKLRLQQGFETTAFDFPDASLHYQVLEVHRCLRLGFTESPRMPHADTLAMLGTLDDARAQIGLRYPAQ